MNLFLSDELTRSLVLEGKGRGSLAKVQLAQCFSPLEWKWGFLLCAWRDSAPALFSSMKSDLNQLGISLLNFFNPIRTRGGTSCPLVTYLRITVQIHIRAC